MADVSRNADVAIPEEDLWEGPWRISEEELRLHAGEGRSEWRSRSQEKEE